MIRRASNHQAPSSVRCAVYTRKSTDEGLDMDFNSLDAQREAGEAYVASQRSQGWVCLDDRFDDGGFTGGNLDRPALKRLLAAVEAGRVDCIVIYKVDRLSRSLLDFTRLVELFDKHGVSLVSVTQPINTRDSAGRLMLNVLLSFAQFEREMVSDRTRDKMAASRRKGMWTGGRPVLGYDVVDKKLVINEAEAAMVREIYRLYLADQSISEVVEEINCRGWVTKAHVTQTGKRQGGRPFTKNHLNHLLANPIYAGRVRYQGEEFPGEHEAIVDEKTFQRVQDLMAKNAQTNGTQARNRYGFLLKGLVRCTACNAPLIPSVSRKGTKVYRYYVCGGAMKKGYRTCPCPQINAQKLEDVIVAQIRVVGSDHALQRETVRQVQEARAAIRPALVSEQKRLRQRLEKVRGQLRHLLDSLASGEHGASVGARIADLEQQAGKVERRLGEILQELAALDAGTVDEADLAKALSLFTPIWDCLFPVEQARVIQLLVERIDHDATNGKLAIEFRPTGINALADEVDAAATMVTA
jgi:site-specific DNA recombinase